MPLLELTDVFARYGPIRALHGVSLKVDEGEVVAVLGANGAGKTTTLRSISGITRTSGEITFDGRRIARKSTESVARLGIADALGLRSFAFHPDFARPGRPGYQKLYTVNTERAAGVARFGGPYDQTGAKLAEARAVEARGSEL
jgi:ABC-type cobalamin/Fe3+-siderophores transport system ATPase subunit